MALTINDRTMTSDRTHHTARLAPGEQRQWEVSWLPGRRVTRNQAITAMTLAEASSPAEPRDRNRHMATHPGLGSRARHDRRAGHTPDRRIASLGRRRRDRPRTARPRGRRMSHPRHAKRDDVSPAHSGSYAAKPGCPTRRRKNAPPARGPGPSPRR